MLKVNHIAHNTVRKSFFEGFRHSFSGRQIFHSLFLFVFVTSFLSSTSAQDSLVGGIIEEDQVWTNDYIYIVYKDLRIPEGITLTIEAGVTVKIDQGRGILVYGGNMLVSGKQDDVIDSVFFIPNRIDRLDGWKWKGISYVGTNGVDSNRISFANIIDAEIAVNIYNCEDIIIENSSILDNQNLGVQLYNSRNCQIVDCLFQNNYDGIEMIATDDNETSGNLIRDCILKNLNHNIYLLKAFGGIFINNLVENNLVEGGNNGIWMDNGGGISFGRNYIHKNIFVNNGSGAGYGLLLSQDSIQVTNNLFWLNHIAIYYDPFIKGNIVKNNSFYQNSEGIMLSTGSVNNEFTNNTFSLNQQKVFSIGETEGVIFSQNNIFTNPWQEKVIANNTPQNIDLDLNYWHSASDADIQKLIWDNMDDPALGTVNYTPVLSDADTTNPVSPPFAVIKQLVDDQVKLSWSSNPEKDFRAYKVYFGDFNNYSFPYSENAEKDTVFYLIGVDISDSIAITVLDGTFDTIDAQTMGHESPFAFASVYPYAGQDDKICQKQNQYHITGSSIPFEYQNMVWLTSGDGIFDNPTFLHPVYYPGPVDRVYGEVILSLEVEKSKEILIDSLILFIYDDPIVFAGNDTVIFADLPLELNTATVANYDSIKWKSSGDGEFTNDTIVNPVYTPGTNDIAQGEVNLVFIAQSDCGIDMDTLRLFLEPFFSIEGSLRHKSQLIEDGVIIAVKDGDEGARAADITHAGTEGYFRFDKMMKGNYYLYAVPDTTLENDAVPAYYANNLKWQDAYYFYVNADIYDVDIALPTVDYILPVGEASISGYFETPPTDLFSRDIYCNSWFDIGDILDYCNGGFSNITVFLLNTNGSKLLDFTLTDENGNFYFRNLPFGNYIIDAEKTGYHTSASSLIALSPDHINETDVVLELSEEKIVISRAGNNTGQVVVEVYPNPVIDILFIPVSENFSATAEINIYNAFGQMVKNIDLPPANNNWQPHLKLDVSKLNTGIYFGRIVGNGITSGFSFIKN